MVAGPALIGLGSGWCRTVARGKAPARIAFNADGDDPALLAHGRQEVADLVPFLVVRKAIRELGKEELADLVRLGFDPLLKVVGHQLLVVLIVLFPGLDVLDLLSCGGSDRRRDVDVWLAPFHPASLTQGSHHLVRYRQSFLDTVQRDDVGEIQLRQCEQ